MKLTFVLIASFILGIIGQAQADYEPGTLEALQYLNNEWVNKPRQMKHERDLMRIQSEGYQNQMNGFNTQPRAQVACHPVPIFSNIDGQFLGYGKRCF